MTRPPWREADWDRLHCYARRIKKIYVRKDGLPGLGIIPYLRIYLPTDHILFPNLEMLYWNSINQPSFFHYASLLVSPSLTDCSLESDVHGGIAVLHSVQRLSPSIQRMFISTPAFGIDVTPMVSPFRLLSSFKYLGMSLAPVTDIAIRTLGGLDNLVEWITNAALNKDTLATITNDDLASFFPSLEVLNVHGTNVQTLARLLKHMKSKSLRILTYVHKKGEPAPKPDTIRSMAVALAAQTAMYDVFLSAERGMQAWFEDLEALTTLQIRKIRLENIVTNNELTNDFISWFTQNWVNLQSFYCCNHDTQVAPSQIKFLPTAEIFGHFASHCPRLTHLWLTIDVTRVLETGDVVLPQVTIPLYYHPHAMLLSNKPGLYRTLEYITKIYPRVSFRLSDDIKFKYSDPFTLEILIPSACRWI